MVGLLRRGRTRQSTVLLGAWGDWVMSDWMIAGILLQSSENML